ncbi:MAG: hypothetical protein IJ188_03130 [Clostridia bacterium]|nr:hypothetical protein [Clostridia bacterium]
MSEKNIISPFQILDWRVISFSCNNLIPYISDKIEHHWTINAHIDQVKSEGNNLRAIIQIVFHFHAEQDGNEMTMNGQCAAMCEMDIDSVPEPESTFQNLLSRTAMTNSLANLRVFLLQAGILHQMGPKRTMLPFINLNHFHFDEDISFTT